MISLQTLDLSEVKLIHDTLTLDFAESDDPIFPAGVRDEGLLASAVGRQGVGFAGKMKYDTPSLSAATLAYGLCNNHPFHNGNKRTSIVAMLVHLDKNGLMLTETTHDDLFRMILAVSQHKFAAQMLPERKAKKLGGRSDPDSEVKALAMWLSQRAHKPQRGERQIPYRQLRRILHRFHFELEPCEGNKADIVRYTEKRTWLGKRVRERKRYAQIGYRDEGTTVSIKDIKLVRQACSLRSEDGVDSSSFYDNLAAVDSFVAEYRSLLKRLARR